MTARAYHSYFTPTRHPVRPAPEQRGARIRHSVAIVGGGPVGLALALGLARRGVGAVVIEPRDGVGEGSRAACISRRSLEIFDRLGIAEGFLAEGLAWRGGRSFYRDSLVFELAMPDDANQKHPPMINLQQCLAEQVLADALQEAAPAEIRWGTRMTALAPRPDGVTLTLGNAHGAYALEADYVVACDGARSAVRGALGLALHGTSYEGRYVIVDILLRSDHPTERRAWFDPPSNPGSTVLMHRQPRDIWRVDYQLRAHEDPEEEVRPERALERVRRHLEMIGERQDWQPVWLSLYKAHCLTLDRYRHGRVLFAGDAAHLVPIFGVRGLNSGIDDTANLAWKLASVIQRGGGEALLDSYSQERVYAARENIRQASKSTEFMTPPTAGHDLMRTAALSLAVTQDFARPLVNPRQTTAIAFPDSPLSSGDGAGFAAGPPAGATLPNFPVEIRRDGRARAGHLLDAMGPDFTALAFAAEGAVSHAGRAALDALDREGVAAVVVGAAEEPPPGTAIHAVDRAGQIARAYGAADGALYLIRPDGHVAGRWRDPDPASLGAALARARAG